jgi:hypothetical protein
MAGPKRQSPAQGTAGSEEIDLANGSILDQIVAKARVFWDGAS